jgi:ATP phosphoribosyltransferase
MITLALAKGRILEETLPLLAAAGIEPTEDAESSRKLILATRRPDLRLILVRAADVPTYVQYGAADLGVAGLDLLAEHGGQGLYQPLDLGIARCRMAVAVPEGFDYAAAVKQGARLRVATKYIVTAREHFAAKGVHVDLMKVVEEIAAISSRLIVNPASLKLKRAAIAPLIEAFRKASRG